MLQAIVIGISTLVAAGATFQPANRRPVRWPTHAVIPVWVERQNTPAGAESLVQIALRTWNRAGDGRFELTSATSRDAAKIRVRFATADGIYGEAAPRVDRTTGFIGFAEVLIAGEIPGDVLHQRIVIYLTALHELGHALGLPHTSAFDDIMYSFRRPDDGVMYFGAYRRKLTSAEDIGTARATGLSPADVQTLKNLYDS